MTAYFMTFIHNYVGYYKIILKYITLFVRVHGNTSAPYLSSSPVKYLMVAAMVP